MDNSVKKKTVLWYTSLLVKLTLASAPLTVTKANFVVNNSNQGKYF